MARDCSGKIIIAKQFLTIQDSGFKRDDHSFILYKVLSTRPVVRVNRITLSYDSDIWFIKQRVCDIRDTERYQIIDSNTFLKQLSDYPVELSSAENVFLQEWLKS